MGSQPASPKVRALQWLAQREHSRLELRGKLLRLMRPASRAMADEGNGPEAATTDPAAEVEALLDWLAGHGYLSDERFVESRVHARQARFGNLRIRQELQRHGAELAPEAQQALRATEFDRALEVWQRKYGRSPTAGANGLSGATRATRETDTDSTRTAGAPEADEADHRGPVGREARAAQYAQATAARLRQMRFLSSRGFSPEVIRRVLAQASSAGLAGPADDDLPDDGVDHALGNLTGDLVGD